MYLRRYLVERLLRELGISTTRAKKSRLGIKKWDRGKPSDGAARLGTDYGVTIGENWATEFYV